MIPAFTPIPDIDFVRLLVMAKGLPLVITGILPWFDLAILVREGEPDGLRDNDELHQVAFRVLGRLMDGKDAVVAEFYEFEGLGFVAFRSESRANILLEMGIKEMLVPEQLKPPFRLPRDYSVD